MMNELINESDFNKIFAENLKYYLSINNMTQAELAHKLSVSAASVTNWCRAVKSPRVDKVDMMCKIFNCRRSDLVEKRSFNAQSSPTKRHAVVIKVLGRVAAGIPIEAVEDVIDTEEITEEMARTGEFFGLQIHGDSMEPQICNGDVVIVRQQDDAESGEIVIAMVNGDDACCKRLMKYAGGISLISLNHKYDPMMFSDKDILDKPVRILGKVEELRRKF